MQVYQYGIKWKLIVSIEYKIYTLCGYQILSDVNCDLFYTKPNKYITFNKSSTSNPLWSDFCGQNTWKMGYFQFFTFADSAYTHVS